MSVVFKVFLLATVIASSVQADDAKKAVKEFIKSQKGSSELVTKEIKKNTFEALKHYYKSASENFKTLHSKLEKVKDDKGRKLTSELFKAFTKTKVEQLKTLSESLEKNGSKNYESPIEEYFKGSKSNLEKLKLLPVPEDAKDLPKNIMKENKAIAGYQKSEGENVLTFLEDFKNNRDEAFKNYFNNLFETFKTFEADFPK